ncbi:MAG: MotA/TolQ/ExbB proton channel family protein [Myxococcota bacterium]|nr:MotA/TolQ/ExbB proton channel family protein [Myxococcota bacterium]
MIWLVRLMTCVLCCGVPAMALSQGFDLEQAFKEEFALLELEKQQLEKQLAALKQESTQERDLKQTIEQLSAKLAQAEFQNHSAKNNLNRQEQSTKDSGPESLRHMIKHSQNVLQGHELDIANPIVPANIEDIFMLAIGQIHEEGQLRRRSRQPYFNHSGQEVTGEVIYLANVGALTRNDSIATALIPIADKGLQRTHQEKTISREKDAVTLWPLHLFHADHRFEYAPQQAATLSHKFNKGGWFMWPILILAILGLMVLLERSIILGRAFFENQKFTRKLEEDIEQGHWQQIEERCQKAQTPLGKAVLYIIKNIHAEREVLEDIICQQLLKCRPQYTRFLNILQMIAVAAPLLGLLGTVTGMIQSFSAMQTFGGSGPQLFSAGISEALLTTQFGLALAIPALLAHALLSRSAERILDASQYVCLLVVNSATMPNTSTQTNSLSLLENA